MAHLSKEYAKYDLQVVHEVADNEVEQEDASCIGNFADVEAPLEAKQGEDGVEPPSP